MSIIKNFFVISICFFSIQSFCQCDINGFEISKKSKPNVAQSNLRISSNTGTFPGIPFHFNTVRALNEINDPFQADAYPWLSNDGLRLYYIKGFVGNVNSIYYTSRPNIDSQFLPSQNLQISTITFPNFISCWLNNSETEIFIVENNKPSNNISQTIYHSIRTSTLSDLMIFK